ncbi:hypothetical protein CRH09_22115 [Nocardia terpenica]|uniref:NERD domain-containing protein n=2 Tax=Nocardia terpenica TaxID=455432 RepID=A0A291RMF8_9NOCA|nr:hypothetical protein CRH09_22115 [Nocardia terpenica]
MITMLVKVRNDDPSRLSSTERTVVNWLKSWTGAHALPGIAVVQAHGADVVVWTPKTCVVMVVKGFAERVNGALTVAADAPWTIDGRIAPLDGVQSGTEPMEQVCARTDEIEQLLRGAPGRERVGVMGIVLVIPQLGTRVQLEKGVLPDGIDVVVGDGPSSLRSYITRITADEPDSWDAAQVGQALGALGFAAAATYSDLTSEGFPAPRTGSDAPPPPAAPPPRPAPAPAGPTGPRPESPAPMAVPLPTGAPIPPPGAGRPVPPGPVAPAPASGAAVPIPPPGGPGPAPAPPPPRPPLSPQYVAAASGYAAPPRESPPTAPTYGAPQSPGTAQQPYAPPPQPYSVPFDPRPPAPVRTHSRGRGIAPLVVLALLVVILATAALCTGGSTRTTPARPGPGASTPASTSTFTTAPERTIPQQTAGPACYPFQPGCPG